MKIMFAVSAGVCLWLTIAVYPSFAVPFMLAVGAMLDTIIHDDKRGR